MEVDVLDVNETNTESGSIINTNESNQTNVGLATYDYTWTFSDVSDVSAVSDVPYFLEADFTLESGYLSSIADETSLNSSHDPSNLSLSTSFSSAQTESVLTSSPPLVLPHDLLSSPSSSSSTSQTLTDYLPGSSEYSFTQIETTKRSRLSSDRVKDKTRDVELLNLFESTIFNQLLENNFVQINLRDEFLANESGLRQLEYAKYQELAKVSDYLHGNRGVTIDTEKSVSEFQISVIHKHTEKLISAVKRITSFTSLCLDDQISLLKSRFIDLCIIKSLIFIEPETRSLKINGRRISMEKCSMMNNGKFYELILSINPILRSDPLINILILLICLFNPETESLRSSYSVRKEYFLTIHLVQKYLEIRGFSIFEANYEIKRLICNLENFLLLFNAKQKIQDIVKRHLGYTSQLIAEMLDVNGQ